VAESDGPSDRGKRGKPRLRVLVVRHGVAEDRQAHSKTGRPDATRRLTKPGRKKMRTAARGLTRLVARLDVLATSPLTRAIETGEILADRFGAVRPVRLPALAPGRSLAQVMDWLREQGGRRPGAVVALVGHEPHLGQMVSWMLTGLRESFVPLKKGAACLLEFADEVKPARAKLLWAMRPSQLRDLAR
jgi:phosphohistidine phosphatase